MIAYPFVVGALAAKLVAGKIQSKLGLPTRVGRSWAGPFSITFHDLEIGASTSAPLIRIRKIKAPFSAAWGSGLVEVSGLEIDARRGGAEDNMTAVLDKLRGRKGDKREPSGAGASSRLPGFVVTDGRLSARDAGSGLSVDVKGLTARLVPGDRMDLHANGIGGVLALGSAGRGPRFGLGEIQISGPLERGGLRPRGYPTIVVSGGYATPLPSLALTGIRGKVHPAGQSGGPAPGQGQAQVQDPAKARELVVDLEGSYGGARETLWTAQGGIVPADREGQLALRANRFTLSKIAEVLPKNVLTPERTNVDATFDVSWAEGAVRFGGDLRVGGLSIQHDGIASEPLRDMNLLLALRGTAFPDARRVAIDRIEARVGALAGKVSGFVELAPGTFTFPDGNKLSFLPRLELALEVPKLPCDKALASLPPALVPHLQGFVLQGTFGAELETRIDYANLEALELQGKVGIDGCKVVKPPPAVKALISGESIVQQVEVPKGPSKNMVSGETEILEFVVGPENPDFVPFDQISPFLIASITTTEDGGFFKHRGWVTSEFKTALRRNLQRGGFRGGASSITMQMVKNVLLSHEKTLSRKLQELFLVWYLEQNIPKERILELYFNAIEFGPRIYGIGRAAQHYFGKTAVELTPLESAFFSSILPSPKRRYIQYCHGTLFPPWDKYVRRILSRVHERGRIEDQPFEEAASQKLVFHRPDPTFTEKQCMEWVKKITARPEPESPPDLDPSLETPAGDEAGAGGASGVDQWRRLFSSAGRRTGKSGAPKASKTAARP